MMLWLLFLVIMWNWGGLTRGKTLQRRGLRMIILQIIGEMFGGMENSLYLCGKYRIL